MGLKQLVTHRVKGEKATKAEKREMAERIEAFEGALRRLAAFGAARTPDDPAFTRADAEQVAIGATRGAGAVSVPRLAPALDRARALRARAGDGGAIDAESGLTAADLDLLLPVAAQALGEAAGAAAAARRARVTSMVWLLVAFVAVITVIVVAIRG